MNKSPQYNQQTAQMQCKSEAEEKGIQQNLETGHHSISAYLKINSGFHTRKNPSEATISENNQIRELHETINF